MEIQHTFDLRVGDGSITEIEITATIEADPADHRNWFVAKIETDMLVADAAPFTVETRAIPDTHYLYEPMLADFLAAMTDEVNEQWAAERAEAKDNAAEARMDRHRHEAV